MALTKAKIEQAITDLSLAEDINFVFGTGDEANIRADATVSGGILVWLSPIVSNYERTTNFTTTYNIEMLWTQLSAFGDIQETTSVPIFEKLDTYAKRHIIQLQANLRAAGEIGGEGTGISSGSILQNVFNWGDSNHDGVLHTFEVSVIERISC